LLQEHSHTPWIVIVYKYLQKWKESVSIVSVEHLLISGVPVQYNQRYRVINHCDRLSVKLVSNGHLWVKGKNDHIRQMTAYSISINPDFQFWSIMILALLLILEILWSLCNAPVFL
jgi:hypothetical protein